MVCVDYLKLTEMAAAIREHYNFYMALHFSEKNKKIINDVINNRSSIYKTFRNNFCSENKED